MATPTQQPDAAQKFKKLNRVYIENAVKKSMPQYLAKLKPSIEAALEGIRGASNVDFVFNVAPNKLQEASSLDSPRGQCEAETRRNMILCLVLLHRYAKGEDLQDEEVKAIREVIQDKVQHRSPMPEKTSLSVLLNGKDNEAIFCVLHQVYAFMLSPPPPQDDAKKLPLVTLALPVPKAPNMK
jgi:hypothetical protein